MHRPFDSDLEAMIDRYGARKVLEAFAEIAYGKAEHIEANWQDKQSARNWSKLGKKLSALVDWSREVVGA